MSKNLTDTEADRLASNLKQIPDITVIFDSSIAFELIGVIQLATRHPCARYSPTIQRAAKVGRVIQDEIAKHSPEVGTFLERGWHEVFDENMAPCQNLEGDAIENCKNKENK